MSFAAVYLPEFPITAWRLGASLPAPAQPMIVLEGQAPQEKVFSLNRGAMSLGIEHGMSKVQAEASGITTFRPRRIAEETSAFAIAAEVAEGFTPRLEAVHSPENAYGGARRPCALLLLDSAGTGTLFGTAESYAEKLYTALKRAGFSASVGTAPNAEASLMLARGTQRLVCANGSNLRAQLAPLPVSLLPCEPKMLALLARWGIRTLGELAALPQTALVSRLGEGGRRLQQLARGEAERLLVPQEPAFTLSETTALDSPLELLDSLLFVLSPMLEALMRKAVAYAYALRSLSLVLSLERGEPHTLSVRPATPTQNREALLKLLNLELQAHPPKAGIISVTLQAEAAQPQTSQRGLFQAQFPDPDKLDLLLARLRSIAGEGDIGAPQLVNSFREDAFLLHSFQPRLNSMPTPMPGVLPARMAIRLFRPPHAVRVAGKDKPRTLFWEGSRFNIELSAGPWHSSGSWWDGNAWDSSLWDVVTAESKLALRLRQENTSGAWFVVGVYD